MKADEHAKNMIFMSACNRQLTRMGKIPNDGTFIMPQERVRVVQNGRGHIVYNVAIYPELPHCWVEDSIYRFNTHVVYECIIEDNNRVRPTPTQAG